MKEIHVCTRCLMNDAADTFISFDEKGQCNYCTDALIRMNRDYLPNEEGERRLKKMIEEIKENGKDKKYDCIMGLSGGLDSSYLAYLGYKWGLRVLAVHIDDGYDTEISKNNLKKLVKKTGFDYEVITPDAQQFNDLTLAYMKAGVPNIAIPQDNVLFAFLYAKMREYKISYFLTGGNFALESILQKGNTHKSSDVVNIMAIHKIYGTKPINNLKFISTIQRIKDEKILNLKTYRPLNLIDYNRDRAFKELGDFCGFEYYGRKHLENILTAFIQLYWLPKKFNVDKRTSHLSSMIISGQMSREDALKELSEPIYNEAQMSEYISFIKKQIGISDTEFDELMTAPVHQHTDYKTEDSTLTYKFFKVIHKVLK